MLTIGNLKAIIEEAETWRGVTDETEVRVAHQPQWAFEYSLDPDYWGVGVVGVPEGSDTDRPEREDFGDDEGVHYQAAVVKWRDEADGERVLYLAEETQIGYLPEDAREVVGW